MAAQFDYLPRQTYVPLGVLNQAAALAPEVQCHVEHALDWLHMEDSLPRETGSGRETLLSSGGKQDISGP